MALYEGEFQVWGFLTVIISKQSKHTTSQHPALMQADVPQNIYDNPLECTDAIHPAGHCCSRSCGTNGGGTSADNY